MRRRRRNRIHNDSMDLLLDAMCNVFGGIVMIALLVSLLVRGAKSEGANGPPPSAEPSRSALVEPLRKTREEIVATKNLLAKLEKDHQAHLAKRDLMSKSEALKAEIKAATVTQEVKRPRKTAQTSKIPFPMVLRYGRVFTLAQMRGGKLEWNRGPMLRWADPTRFSVVEAHGWIWPEQRRRLDNLITESLNRDEIYITVYTYPDSFEQLIELQSVLDEAGFENGWSPLSAEQEILPLGGPSVPVQ